MELPPGFQLDEPKKHEPAGLPAGFVLDGQEPAKGQTQPEASPWANRAMAFATGADDAMLNIPSNLAAGLRALTHGQSYNEAYNTIKQAGEQSSQNHGLAYGAGVFGGLGATLPLMPEAAPTVAGRAAQSAAIGAGMGGVSEFADTKDIGAAAKAAAIGAATGGVMSPAVDAAAYGVSHVAKPVIGMARGLLNPEEEAARRVQSALRYDAKRGDIGLTPQQFQQYSDANHPVIVADLGGEGTRALARSSANTDPGARTALNDAITERTAATPERIAQELDNISGGFSRASEKDALTSAKRQANSAAYDTFYKATEGGLNSPTLNRILSTNAGQKAAETSMRTVADDYAMRGVQAPPSGLVKVDGKWAVDPNANGPTGAFWDQFQRNLMPGGIGKLTNEERISQGLGKGVNAELDRLTQQADGTSLSQNARQGAARFFGAEDAIDAGAKALPSARKMTNDEWSKGMSTMTAEERNMFGKSAAEDLANRIRNPETRNSTIRALSDKGGDVATRLKTALGGQSKLNELEASIHVKDIADRFKNAVTGNSTTARQLAEMGLAGGVGASGSWLMGGDVKDMSLGAAFANLARFGAVKIDARVAERVGQLLASNDPNKMQQVTKMATKNPRIMSLLRNFQLEASSGAGRIAGDSLGGK